MFGIVMKNKTKNSCILCMTAEATNWLKCHLKDGASSIKDHWGTLKQQRRLQG